MKRIKGFTLIELLIVVAIIAILAAIAIPNFLEAQVRSKVSRVRSDHRSLATAIEAYYVDNNSYPAATNVWNLSAYGHLAAFQTLNCRTFKVRTGAATTQMLTLTTPIAYVTSYFADPFADTRGAIFPYYSTRSGWILGSFGPDTDQKNGGSLEWCGGTFTVGYRGTATNPSGTTAIETIYDPRESQPSTTLLVGAGSNGAFTYDPTNGTVSRGDVWRVKQ